MENGTGAGVKGFLRSAWRWVRWPLAVVAVLYVVAILYELTQLPKKTAATVAAIHAQKLTMDDVDGKHLPPVPDPKLVDATVEGVDVNKNGIRDDVELAIFKKYPNDVKVRAAELQYAMALQMYLSGAVFNSDTLVAVINQDERGSFCVRDTFQKPVINASDQVWNEFFKTVDSKVEEVENLVLNTSARHERYERVFEKYMTSYGADDSSHCDIGPLVLKN